MTSKKSTQKEVEEKEWRIRNFIFIFGLIAIIGLFVYNAVMYVVTPELGYIYEPYEIFTPIINRSIMWSLGLFFLVLVVPYAIDKYSGKEARVW